MKTFKAAIVFALCAAPWGVPKAAKAQSYPTKPIMIVVQGAAGGLSDVALRMYAEKASQKLGQKFIIENRVGAGGLLAAQAVARAKPDGYTLGLTTVNIHELMPHMQSVPIDMINDFQFISILFGANNYVVANAALPANTLAEALELARQRPNGLTIGVVGPSPTVMAGGVKLVSGARLEIIYYRALERAMGDLSAGLLDLALGGYANFESPLADRKLKVLAAVTFDRTASFPDVPAFAELG